MENSSNRQENAYADDGAPAMQAAFPLFGCDDYGSADELKMLSESLMELGELLIY